MSQTAAYPLSSPPPPPAARKRSPFWSLVSALALAGAPALLLAITVARGGSLRDNPAALGLLFLTGIINLVVIARDLRHGLALFLVAAGLSPKLPGLYDNLRVEDFVFVLVFGMWLFRGIRAGSVPGVRSPIVFPFLILTVAGVVSLVWGMSIGTIPDPKYSVFLQLKRIEYFLIFWVVATTVRDENWLRLLSLVFVASGALAGAYGIMNAEADLSQDVTVKRVMGPEGENYNTLSGYLVVCIGAGFAMLPGYRHRFQRGLMMAFIAMSALGLLASYSREGYVMLVGTLLVFGATRHRWLVVAAFAALALAIVGYQPVRERFQNTIEQVQKAPVDDPGSNSLTARFRAWEYRYNGWFLKQPLLGTGVGSIPLSVDNEYLLRACEVGLLGLGVFLWWLFSVYQSIQRALRYGGFTGLLALGLLAGFVGLLIQGLVGASFTTIRTMEPFWFLLGLVTASVLIQRRQRREQQAAAAASVPGAAPAVVPA